jgi:hypothetical protein
MGKLSEGDKPSLTDKIKGLFFKKTLPVEEPMSLLIKLFLHQNQEHPPNNLLLFYSEEISISLPSTSIYCSFYD